jgi:hypothetical protein
MQNLFSNLVRDRRALAFLGCAILAVMIGFVAVSPSRALWVMTFGGYWMMLALFALWLVSLWRVNDRDLAAWKREFAAPRWPWLVIMVGWLVLLVHDPFGFKILMDEAMLAGTSMSMHFEKIALVPMRGHDIQGAFELLGGQLDKRPLFQPFLVSLLHDFTGYRPENGFWLNGILALALLVLTYRAGSIMAGRAAGALAVALLVGLPLLAQNATGAGFELLNLVMIVALFLTAVRYAQRRDAPSVDLLVMTAVLLALTRYESVLFTIPIAGLILWGWLKERRIILGWISALSPLYLIPYALHNKVFSVRESSWEMGSLPGFEVPFSLSYIGDNIAHAMVFFFDTTGEHSNSIVIGVLGVIAVPFFILWLVKGLRTVMTAKPAEVALIAIALGFIAHTVLMMCYFWGRFDDPVIRRLSLPLNLFIVFAVVFVTARFPGTTKKWWGLAAITFLGFFAYSLPSMARHDYSLDYYVGRETAWRREFIAAHPERDYLVIDPNSIEWIIHKVSSTPIVRAVNDPAVMRFNLRNGIFSELFVFQRFEIDPASGEMNLPAEYDLGPAYELEEVWQRRFTPFAVSRISRVVSIAEATEPVEGPENPPDLADLSDAERKTIREAYMENFVQKLP